MPAPRRQGKRHHHGRRSSSRRQGKRRHSDRANAVTPAEQACHFGMANVVTPTELAPSLREGTAAATTRQTRRSDRACPLLRQDKPTTPTGQAPSLQQGQRHRSGTASPVSPAEQARRFVRTNIVTPAGQAPSLRRSKHHHSDRTSAATPTEQAPSLRQNKPAVSAGQTSPRQQDKRCHFGRVSVSTPTRQAPPRPVLCHGKRRLPFPRAAARPRKTQRTHPRNGAGARGFRVRGTGLIAPAAPPRCRPAARWGCARRRDTSHPGRRWSAWRWPRSCPAPAAYPAGCCAGSRRARWDQRCRSLRRPLPGRTPRRCRCFRC